MVDAGDRGGDMVDSGWNLADLTGLISAAADGTKDYMGLDAMVDPMANASTGWVEFQRTGQKCKKDYGDGDSAMGSSIEVDDDVPVKDEREFTTGTLIVEDAENTVGTSRSYVTAGQVILKFETPDATFGASWMLTTK